MQIHPKTPSQNSIPNSKLASYPMSHNSSCINFIIVSNPLHAHIYKTTNPATPKITSPITLPNPSPPTLPAAPVTTGNNPDVVAFPPKPPLGLAVAVVVIPTSVVAVNVLVRLAVTDPVAEAVAVRFVAMECCSLRILEM